MLLLSLRVNKKLICAACCFVAIGLLTCAAFLFLEKGGGPVAVTMNGNDAVVKNYTAADNEQRLTFVAQFGWEVEAEPVEIKDVLIPKEFDEVYEEYNALQKGQGLDLERYAGKKAKRYAYAVLNYPDSKDEVRLNLLCAENKIIGGDVCSMALDGFMHGFRYDG